MKLSMNRRSFLKASAAAPVAARTLSQQLAAAVGGFSMDAAMAAGVSALGSTPPACPLPIDQASDLDRQSRLLRALRLYGIPSWKRKEFRRYARNDRILDPDIAVLRSISLSTKLRIQWARNELRWEQREIENLTETNERSSWFERFGIAWW